MNRRQLLAVSALALLPAPIVSAGEVSRVEYSRDAYEQLLASGKPFLLDFFAPW